MLPKFNNRHQNLRNTLLSYISWVLCCVVFALMMGAAARVSRRLRGVSAVKGGFAPVACRAGPGGSDAPPLRSSSATRPTARSAAFRGVAISIAVFVLITAALVGSGVLVRTAGEGWWVLRTVLFAVVAAGAWWAAAGRGPAGPALLTGGLAWLVLGELDVHAFGLWAFSTRSESVHLLFHGGGAAAALVGLTLTLTPPTRPAIGKVSHA